MLKNYYKRIICLFLLIFFIKIKTQSLIDKNYVQSHKNKFEQYIKDLKLKMSPPTFIIKKSMTIMGYAEHEIDAVPIAFPFIYNEKYKTVWLFLDNNTFIEEVNVLLNEIEKSIIDIANKNERRKQVHHIIHMWNCKKLSLPLQTTTKQLAQIIENKQIDMQEFFRYQLIQFFVKYHLDM